MTDFFETSRLIKPELRTFLVGGGILLLLLLLLLLYNVHYGNINNPLLRSMIYAVELQDKWKDLCSQNIDSVHHFGMLLLLYLACM